jgi:hypothetical protein
MKRFFIGMMVVAMLALAPTVTHAVTIAELQAMIAQLTAQLNVLISQQQTSTSASTNIINPTATSTGLVSFGKDQL